MLHFSPRVWGWPVEYLGRRRDRGLLPTRVGMAPVAYRDQRRRGASPHACGDGPISSAFNCACMIFSPRVWGWPLIIAGVSRQIELLPTRVGMALSSASSRVHSPSSPHACGDGPVLRRS